MSGDFDRYGELMTKVKQPCCIDWDNAHRKGSEDYYWLVIYKDRGPLIGDIDTPVRFCPWCGDKKK